MTEPTVELSGIGVSPGIATGPVARMAPPPTLGPPETAADPAAERASATAALEGVAGQLEARAAMTTGEAADVLNAQVLMTRDPMLATKVAGHIDAGLPAAHAVAAA